MSLQLEPIERIGAVSVEEFRRRYDDNDRPVIITGGASHWPAMKKWSIAFMRDKVGDKMVPVQASPDGRIPAFPEKGFSENSQVLTLREFIDLTFGPQRDDSTYYYCDGKPMDADFPELLEDVEFPPFMSGLRAPRAFVWIGREGTNTTLHYDNRFNLLVMVKGVKRVLLFSPDQTPDLYPYPVHATSPNLSRLSLQQLDYQRFPRAKRIKALEGVLQPGDMLFMPCAWWHEVHTLEDGISVNLMARPALRHHLLPSMMRLSVRSAVQTLDELRRRLKPTETEKYDSRGA